MYKYFWSINFNNLNVSVHDQRPKKNLNRAVGKQTLKKLNVSVHDQKKN